MNPQTTTGGANAPTILGAAEEGDAAAVARLLAAGASADERAAPGGDTPLMRAAARGHEEVVRALLDAGADPCARRADDFTPLILAVFFGHEEVVRLIVERGADASARTSLGTTAARWAESRGFSAMAERLRAAEASSGPRVAAGAREKAGPVRRRETTKPFDEVEIFSKRRAAADREELAADPPAPAPDGAARREESFAEGDSSPAAAAAASGGRGAQATVRASAATFRLGHFLRSWQGSVGMLLLLAAFGVTVFALVRGGTAPRDAAPPAPTASQADAQQTPAPPTPGPQGVIPAPEQGQPAANTAGPPYYVTTGPAAPVSSDAPGELKVVSESGGTPTQDAGQSGRRAGANNNSTNARNDNASDAALTLEPEPTRPAPPAAPTNRTPAPAPQPTPGRTKVIQWPPQ